MTKPAKPRAARSPATNPAATLRAVPAVLAAAPDDAPARPPRENGWTRARQVAFLAALAASHSVSEAAREAGMSRQSAYALRARLKGEPFDLAWGAAFRCRFDALAEAALDRAINGVEVQHFYNGELVGTSRRYDERLTLALLAMRSPFSPRQTGRTHPAADYATDAFGALLERVGQGPQTWTEEMARKHEASCAAFEADEAAARALEEAGWPEETGGPAD